MSYPQVTLKPCTSVTVVGTWWAVLFFTGVVPIAPQHTQTRLTLAILYSVLGMTEGALVVLDEG